MTELEDAPAPARGWRYVPVLARSVPESLPFFVDEWDPELAEAVEAGDSTRSQRAKAHEAGKDVRADKGRLERDASAAMRARMEILRNELRAAILVETDFRRFQLERLLGDVNRIIGDTQTGILGDARTAFGRAAELGAAHVDQSVLAADVGLVTSVPGIDSRLVAAAFDNTVDLLTDTMREFRTRAVSTVRRIALGVDSFSENMVTLAREIGDGGLANPEYKAERILRTEVGRTFNGATYDRQVELAERMPFLRKTWIRTKDSRTRLSHVSAGAMYARGKGIAIKDLYQVGAAKMRYPVDPLAEPAGKVAAAETIQCRCLAAVDFDPAEMARAGSARLSLALGAPPASVGPKGPAVSLGLNIPNTRAMAPVRRALEVLDSVHGDGVLPTIPALPNGSRKAHAGYVSLKFSGRSLNLFVNPAARAKAPHMTTFHEVGHFVDHKGFGEFGEMAATSKGAPLAPAVRDAVEKVMSAARASAPIRTLESWYRAKPGQRPLGVTMKFTGYLLQRDETFARAYAQYVAVVSKDARALRELRAMQTASEAAKFGAPGVRQSPTSVALGETPELGKWTYPWQWSDAEFAPIRAAFDELFSLMGWRE